MSLCTQVKNHQICRWSNNCMYFSSEELAGRGGSPASSNEQVQNHMMTSNAISAEEKDNTK